MTDSKKDHSETVREEKPQLPKGQKLSGTISHESPARDQEGSNHSRSHDTTLHTKRHNDKLIKNKETPLKSQITNVNNNEEYKDASAFISDLILVDLVEILHVYDAMDASTKDDLLKSLSKINKGEDKALIHPFASELILTNAGTVKSKASKTSRRVEHVRMRRQPKVRAVIVIPEKPDEYTIPDGKKFDMPPGTLKYILES